MFKAWGDCAVQKDAAGKVISEAATLSCVPIVFLNLLTALLAFTGLAALIMFIIGGFGFMNAKGEAKKIEGAKHTFVYGIIGLSIVLLSFLLMNVISTVTGVECIRDGGFNFFCK